MHFPLLLELLLLSGMFYSSFFLMKKKEGDFTVLLYWSVVSCRDKSLASLNPQGFITVFSMAYSILRAAEGTGSRLILKPIPLM